MLNLKQDIADLFAELSGVATLEHLSGGFIHRTIPVCLKRKETRLKKSKSKAWKKRKAYSAKLREEARKEYVCQKYQNTHLLFNPGHQLSTFQHP